MSRMEAPGREIGPARDAAGRSTGSLLERCFRRPRGTRAGLAALLLAVGLVAVLLPGARGPLVRAGSYLAPLALFVGVLSVAGDA